MYALFFYTDVRKNTWRTLLFVSADVWWGTTGYTLTNNTLYFVNSTTSVCSKVPNVCYFLGWLPDNTWSHKITFGLLCNSTQRMPLRIGHPLLFGLINTHHTKSAPKPLSLPPSCLLAVCECFDIAGGGTLQVSLQGGNVRFLRFLITLLYYSIVVLCC